MSQYIFYLSSFTFKNYKFLKLSVSYNKNIWNTEYGNEEKKNDLKYLLFFFVLLGKIV